MSELRKDPIDGRWVIIATERARRPGTFIGMEDNVFEDQEGCPFCQNQDSGIYSVKNDDSSQSSPWKIRVLPSGTPIVKTEVKFQRRGHGLYDVVSGFGVHEVVIETPNHIANMADLDIAQIKSVIETYVVRFKELEKSKEFQYALAYKSYGWAAGSRRIGHSRSQIIATAVNPLHIKEKLTGAKQHFDNHDRCIYCDILRHEEEFKKRIVVETEHFVALTPFASRFPFEIWILPRKHDCDFSKGVVGQEEDLAGILKDVLTRFKVGMNDPAYNYVIQTAPFRLQKKTDKWQTIHEDYHWHIEVMPRISRAAGFEKGTGFYICAIPPEHTAEFLREVQI